MISVVTGEVDFFKFPITRLPDWQLIDRQAQTAASAHPSTGIILPVAPRAFVTLLQRLRGATI